MRKLHYKEFALQGTYVTRNLHYQGLTYKQLDLLVLKRQTKFMQKVTFSLISEPMPEQLVRPLTKRLCKAIEKILIPIGFKSEEYLYFSCQHTINIAIKISETGITKTKINGPKDQRSAFFIKKYQNLGYEIIDDENELIAIKTEELQLRSIIGDVLDRALNSITLEESIGQKRWIRPIHGIRILIAGEVIVEESDDYRLCNCDKVNNQFTPIELPIQPEQLIAQSHIQLLKEFKESSIEMLSNRAPCVGGLYPKIIHITEKLSQYLSSILEHTMKENELLPIFNDHREIVAVMIFSSVDIESQKFSIPVMSHISDIKFFTELDASISIDNKRERLQEISFYSNHGTMAEHVARSKNFAKIIISSNNQYKQLLDSVITALDWCKIDLSDKLTDEYPILKGIVSSNYARNSRIEEEVCLAIRDHYSPVTISDPVPTSPITAIAAIAGKLDMLLLVAKENSLPTGAQDPLEIRRLATSIVRIALERDITIPIAHLELSNEQILALWNFLAQRIAHITEQSNKSISVELIMTMVKSRIIGNSFGYQGKIDSKTIIQDTDILDQWKNNAHLIGLKRLSNLSSKSEKNWQFSTKPLTDYKHQVDDIVVKYFFDISSQIHQLQQGNFVDLLEGITKISADIDNFLDHNHILVGDPSIISERKSIIEFILIQIASITG